MQDIIGIYKKILEDKAFSRGEKQAINRVLDEAGLNQRQLAKLRNELFHMVKQTKSRGSRDHQLLLDWLQIAMKTTIKPPQSLNVQSYFSPGDDCRRAICRSLQHMQRGADICVFTITDNQISEFIVKAHAQGKALRIISDNEKALDSGSDIESFIKAGIAVRVDNSPHHMHHKFAVIDNTRLLTGSYNWTRSAAENNCENLLVIDDEQTARPYRRQFAQLWDQCDPYK